MSRPVAVLHVGPSPRFPGGIGTVMTVLATSSPVPAAIVASWEPAGAGRRLCLCVRAAWAVARAPRSAVIHVHMAADGSAVRKGLLLRVARITGHRAVVTLHGSRFAAFAASRPRLVGLALRPAQRIFVLSPELRGVAERCAPRVPAILVANPVEIDDRVAPAGERPPTVVFAGEVSSRKGADVLCAAWPAVRVAVPGARLEIAGPPSDLPDAAVAGDGIELLGPLPRERVRALLRAARVVALASRAEALPMVLLEAMGSGTPFVATEVGDIARLIATGGGVAVPVGDTDALAAALIAFLDSPERATRAGRAGWDACRAEFGAARIAAEIVAAYPPQRRR